MASNSWGPVFPVSTTCSQEDWRAAVCFCLKGARRGQDNCCPSISIGRRQGGRAITLHHAVRNRGGASPGRSIARLDPRTQDRSIRARSSRKLAGRRAAAKPALFLRSRTWRNDQADFRCGRTYQARRASSSIACPRYGCSRKARFATAPDPGASSTILPSTGATV